MPFEFQTVFLAPGRQPSGVITGKKRRTAVHILLSGPPGPGSVCGVVEEQRQNVREPDAVASDQFGVKSGGSGDVTFGQITLPERLIGEDSPDLLPEGFSQFFVIPLIGHFYEAVGDGGIGQVGDFKPEFLQRAIRIFAQGTYSGLGIFHDERIDHAAAGPAAFVIQHHGQAQFPAFIPHHAGQFKVPFP